jgi:maltose O-acetyltransferase
VLSNRELMLAGEIYDSRDPELLALAHRARELIAAFSAIPSVHGDRRTAVLKQLLGAVGDGVWVEPPFFCDYGVNVTIGANTFVNVNCVFLDSAKITIGANVLIGPGVQLLTATHPLRAEERVINHPDASTTSGGPALGSPYRTKASPIHIGDKVWLGAGALVMPGVTIGANSTVGAGSVVTSDIPANCLAFGNPCRVEREL